MSCRHRIIDQLRVGGPVHVYQLIQGWRFQLRWWFFLRQPIGEKLLDHKDVMDQFAQASGLASNIDIKRT